MREDLSNELRGVRCSHVAGLIRDRAAPGTCVFRGTLYIVHVNYDNYYHS